MVSSQAVMLNQFTEQFKESLKSEENAWLRGLRADAFSFFSASGFPTVQNEDWKYTNVGKVGSEQWKVGGKSLSDPELIGAFEALLKNFDYKRNGFTALNLAFADIVCIRIPKETKLEKPIEVLLTGDDENTANFPHVLIIAEAGSKARILETYTSLGKNFTNTAVQIVVEDNANLTHYRVQKESAEAFHIGTTDVTLGRGSLYDSTNINLGAVLSRHDINVKFSAEGGECFVDGLYMLNGSQHSDTHSVIDHAMPNCVSHQTYKGVLNDKSRGVFNGKVFVRENASGTDAKQSNKNLLLSNEARVDTKPQLEIFNDDVKCAHGATVGQLEEEELFYLLTRGLNNELARNLLTYGFAEEIINKIGIESIKKQLDEAVLNRLNANLEA
ncbi:MAG: Fe-S cluster assembly protein SufD [Pyrinomonadaceae bacterium]|jgi:Fe-S cluster assembly protein SufD|nr:Fe-S cluster assembly protein SufD [Blastocatellia bacterium]